MFEFHKLKELASKVGIHLIGVVSPQRLGKYKKVLEERYEVGYSSPFESKDHELRTNPLIEAPWTKSIIVIGVNYYHNHKPVLRPSQGTIARVAWGEDYHKVVGDFLKELISLMEKEEPTLKSKILVDNHPLLERALAFEGGVGRYGKNCTIISPKYGSWIFIGVAIVSMEIEESDSLEGDCGTCSLCVSKCPTGALVEPWKINTKQCLAYWTQAKGIIPREIRENFGTSLYGCDLCQESCPSNQEISEFATESFRPESFFTEIDLQAFFKLDRKGFVALLGSSAAGWRGKNPLQRNALIILANEKNPAYRSLFLEALQDARPYIRVTAGWALGKLGTDKDQVLKAFEKEKDPDARKDFEETLKEWPKNPRI